MNETTLAMVATLEIAAHERSLLRMPEATMRPAPTQAIAKRLTGFDRGLQLLMPKLAVAGIVVGVRGRHGGHRLARSESEITLRQVCDAVEKPSYADAVDSRASISSRVQWIVYLAQLERVDFLASWTLTTVLDREIDAWETVVIGEVLDEGQVRALMAAK